MYHLNDGFLPLPEESQAGLVGFSRMPLEKRSLSHFKITNQFKIFIRRPYGDSPKTAIRRLCSASGH
jgi:hypothetical protein